MLLISRDGETCPGWTRQMKQNVEEYFRGTCLSPSKIWSWADPKRTAEETLENQLCPGMVQLKSRPQSTWESFVLKIVGLQQHLSTIKDLEQFGHEEWGKILQRRTWRRAWRHLLQLLKWFNASFVPLLTLLIRGIFCRFITYNKF